MAAVAFNYSNWAIRYPELAGSVNSTLAQMYFNEAGIYCDNTANSLITDDSAGGLRSMLLNMLTAHIAALNAVINGQASSSIVGRVTSASEGSVSVSADYQAPGSAAWFAQTKYGAAYWQATSAYRSFRYLPPT